VVVINKMGENNFKNAMEKRKFQELEQQASSNISYLLNPKEDPYQKKQREILNSIFGENSQSVIKKRLNNST